jgi:CRISPR/Cas system CMR-associated protein Cmr3 (group 5 of RAMP superfamily)
MILVWIRWSVVRAPAAKGLVHMLYGVLINHIYLNSYTPELVGFGLSFTMFGVLLVSDATFTIK